MRTELKRQHSMKVFKTLFLFLMAFLAAKNSYSQCSGQISSGASSVGLYGSNPSSYYTLYYANGTSAGSEQQGSSGSITWSGLGAGTYYAKCTSGTCLNWTSGNTTISSGPTCGSISISPEHEPKVCVGGTIRLTPTGGYNYSWTTDNYDPHATGSTYIDATPSVTTIYTLHGTESVCNTPQTFQLQVVVGQPKVGQVTLTNQGPNSWCQGAVTSTLFTASATNAFAYIWSVPSQAGTASLNADATQCTVTWNSSYNGSFNVGVTAYSNGCPDNTSASIPLTIYSLPGAPTGLGPTTALYNSSVPLTASGAGANEVYKWTDGASYNCQGGSASCSTPVLNSSPSFNYYATKYNTATSCETAPSQKVLLTINLYLNPPPPASVTVNTCSAKTVTTGAPPTNVTYYLQTDPNGRSTANPTSGAGASITSSGQYYVNASANTTTLWSSSVPLSQTSTTVNPVDLVVTSYDPTNTLVQATHSITLKPGFYVSSGNLFNAKIVISPECNSLVNWEETITYNETGAVVADSRRYYDGFGTTLENQTKNITQGVVFANQTIKDSYLNPTLVTLPAPILENDFIFKDALLFNASHLPYSSIDFDTPSTLNNPVAAGNPAGYVGGTPMGSIGEYYNSANALEPNTPTTSYPYSRSYTPPGPNPLTSKSAGPGDAYRMGSNHEAQSDKSVFSSTDISHYLGLRSFYVPSTSTVINYSGIVGYRIISTDPDRKQSASFTDADGRTLASVMISSGYGVTPITYDNNTWSYNYYNDLGQLVASIAPNGIAVNGALVSTAVAPVFVTTYRYDNLGRLIETTSPDEGTSQFVYSTDGKIRFSQNQEQRASSPKRFSYTNYDYLGRLVESGEYTSNGTSPFNFDAVYVTTPSANSVLSIVDNNIPQGYDIESFTSANFTGPSFKLDNVRCTDYSFIKYDVQPSDFPTGDANHPAQHNLVGQISKTQNANATTWYSYDEFGRVEWTVQSIVGLGNKTIDYTYDFLGQVTKVSYQDQTTAQTDRFFHHYTYNMDGQLTDVATSFDGTNTTPQAKYKYYLHGPLKRVELASSLQGIDYVYTINGALKGINHADVSNDPGHDGSNGFSTDVFGETLNYFSNDYTGAGYNAGSFGLTNYYGGQINSTSWFTPVDNGTTNMKMYAYSYDNLNRFTNAQWGTASGSGGSYTATLTTPSMYNEMITAGPKTPYDNNGNINGLTRRNKSGLSTAYTYNYKLNTNQLASVSGGANTVSYLYNNIGQMTQQTEGSKTMKVSYNAYGLTKDVKDGLNNLTEQYFYDDRGDLVKKLYYSAGNLFKTAYFVRDASGNVLATYEQNTGGSMALRELPIYGSGRLGMVKMKAGQPKYFYEMTDHLGNVRTVIGSPFTDNFVATMEPANAPTETKQFVDITSTAIPYGSANHTTGGSYVSRLNALQNGSTAPHIVGPGIILAVSPGDVISASVYGYYEGSSGNGTGNLSAATVATALVGALGGVTPGDPSVFQNSVTSAYSGSGPFASELSNSNDAVPHAYLNMIQFDGYLNYDNTLPSQAATFSSPTPGTKLPISFSNVTITKPGYVYIWADVTGNSSNYVYFDDLSVSQLHSPIVAGGDFYPFGLTIDDRQIKSERYRYGYQGQYAEYDSLTKLNSFELRMYDPRFGRWLSTDPYGQFASGYVGMGNNPVNGVDPDGGLFGISWSEFTSFLFGGNFESDFVNGVATRWGYNPGLFNQIGEGLAGLGKNSGIITGAASSYLNTYQSSPKWKPVASANLPFVPQAPYAEWCVYASAQSVESWLGGSRTAADFAKWQNGGVALDKGTGTVGDWINFWKKNFPYPNFQNGATTAPSSSDIINGFNKNQIYSVSIHESTFPAGYDHNVLIQSVEQNVKNGNYRYVLMDPNGVRSLPEKYFKSVHKIHVIIQK